MRHFSRASPSPQSVSNSLRTRHADCLNQDEQSDSCNPLGRYEILIVQLRAMWSGYRSRMRSEYRTNALSRTWITRLFNTFVFFLLHTIVLLAHDNCTIVRKSNRSNILPQSLRPDDTGMPGVTITLPVAKGEKSVINTKLKTYDLQDFRPLH